MTQPILFRRAAAAVFASALFAFAATAGTGSDPAAAAAAAAEVVPPAPAFDGWVLKQDVEVQREKIDAIEARLDGKIKSLRNATYEVKGKTVQVNVIVPRDGAEADKIYRALAKLKPLWAVVRKADVVYEFVGPNKAVNEMKKAHDQLAAAEAK